MVGDAYPTWLHRDNPGLHLPKEMRLFHENKQGILYRFQQEHEDRQCQDESRYPQPILPFRLFVVTETSKACRWVVPTEFEQWRPDIFRWDMPPHKADLPPKESRR